MPQSAKRLIPTILLLLITACSSLAPEPTAPAVVVVQVTPTEAPVTTATQPPTETLPTEEAAPTVPPATATTSPNPDGDEVNEGLAGVDDFCPNDPGPAVTCGCPTEEQAVKLGCPALITSSDGPPVVFGIEWTEIPAGSFIMGSPADHPLAFVNETPAHTVTLDTYWISTYEITNAQYKAFIDETGHRLPILRREDYAVWTDAEYAEFIEPFLSQVNWDEELRSYPPGTANYPVTQVDWSDAIAFTAWLSQKIGRPVALPSEAEWEKAARGPDERLFPWGSDFNGNSTNYCDQTCLFEARKGEVFNDGYLSAAPVGSYPQGVSPYGVHDLSGNVWEWTRTRYVENYPYSFELETADPAEVELITLRGGGWLNSVKYMKATTRLRDFPTNRDMFTGIRVVIPSN